MSNIIDLQKKLSELIFSTNAQLVLGFFLNHPDNSYYDREVSNLTKISRAGTNFALRELANVGLLLVEKKGRMSFYSVSRKSCLLKQLRVVQNVVHLIKFVSELEHLSLRIVLFGSASKGENDNESDVDIFILTRSKEKVEKIMYKYLVKNMINPVVHTPGEWVSIEKKNTVFSDQVKQGLVLWESDEQGI